ncbi:MAG: SH3 domain-containing protein [Chloroflexi bacterium]|nr:SH3 domain-containing protein [Chloroflexota bacterium]
MAFQPVGPAPQEPAAEPTPEPTPEPPKKRSNLVFLIKDDAESAVALGDCHVRARQNIHVRLAPAGERIGLVIAGHTFRALARTENWFKVEYEGAERWVSSHFVNMVGPCQLPEAGEPAVSFEDLRAIGRKLSNRLFLIGDAVESAVILEDCQVTPREVIRVRMEPAGQRTGLVMAGHTLMALARTENWYMVNLDGAERWVSAHFVNLRGHCQPQADSRADGATAASPQNDSAQTDDSSSLAFLLEDEPNTAVLLEDCRVTTRQGVLARMTPAGEETEILPGGETRSALARTGNWFLVLLNGAARWIPADLVDMEGGCQ